jgi:hypothetical protein
MLDSARINDQFATIRIETCRELLPLLKAHEENKFQRYMTWDESQFILEFHHSMKWSVLRDDILQKVKQQIGLKIHVDHYLGTRSILRRQPDD